MFRKSTAYVIRFSDVQTAIFVAFEYVNVEHISTPACRHAGLCHLSFSDHLIIHSTPLNSHAYYLYLLDGLYTIYGYRWDGNVWFIITRLHSCSRVESLLERIRALARREARRAVVVHRDTRHQYGRHS